MSRFIVDTNQVSDLLRTHELLGRWTIVLPPLVWAEVLLSAYGRERVRALAQTNIEFCLEPHDCYALFSLMTEEEIVEFEPFVPQNDRIHFQLLDSLGNPTTEMIEKARSLKEASRQNARKNISWLRERAKENRDAKSRGESNEYERYTSIDKAMNRFARNADSLIAKSLINEVTSQGSRKSHIESDRIFAAAMANTYVRRLYELYLCFTLGHAGAWSEQSLNVDLSENRDDFTDMTLGLYLGDGNTLITADKKLTHAVRHIDTKSTLTVCSWQTLIGRL